MTSQLLLASQRRVRASRLTPLLLAWSTLSFLSFFWPSKLLLAPWLTQLSAMDHLDLSVIRWPVSAAQLGGVLGLLILVYLARLMINPLIDAFVYGRLLGTSQSRLPFRGFYRVYLLEMLLLSLAAWVLYLNQQFCWSLLSRPPLLIGCLALLGAVAYTGGLVLSAYKVGLFSSTPPVRWEQRPLMQIALAQCLLTVLFAAVVLGLNYLATRWSGPLLLCSLLLIASVRSYGRIWKIACAIQIWQAN